MDAERQMGSAHVQSQLGVNSTPCLRSAVEGRRVTQSYSSSVSTGRHSNTEIYPSLHSSREIIQYQSSVATTRTLGRLSAESKSLPDQKRLHPNPAYFDSAFIDPSLNWSRSAYETTLREMPKELDAVDMNRSRQNRFWPMDVAAKFPEKNSLPFRQVGIGNRGHSTDLEHLQHSQSLSYPFANMYTAPGVERIGYSLNPSYGRERESAFTTLQTHAPPASCSPLDLEIRRLQGMITRVEMLREKYKYQEGSLKYPKPSADEFCQSRPSGQSSRLASCCMEQWKGKESLGNPESNPRLPNGHPIRQDASQLYSPKQNEWVSQRPKCPTAPFYQVHGAYLPQKHQEGLPRIVDVRSLAQEQALYAENMNTPYNEGVKLAPSPRRCMMSTESGRETGSVESLDSGVECMASPTDVLPHRSIATAPVRFKQLEDVHLKDLVPIQQEYLHPASRNKGAVTARARATSPTSLHMERGPVPALATYPLMLSPSRKRPLPRCTFENEIKRLKNVGSSSRLPKYVCQEYCGISAMSGDDDRALDLSVKKKPAHGLNGQHEIERPFEIQTQLLNPKAKNEKVETRPFNLSAPAAAVGAGHKRHSLGSSCSAGRATDCCPPGLLHHHGKASSMEDLVALSVKLANEVPHESGFQNPVKGTNPEQQMESRGQFITKLIERAEDMLQRPKPLSNKTVASCAEHKWSSSGIVKESRNNVQNISTQGTTIHQEKHLYTYLDEKQTRKAPDLFESNLKSRVPGSKNPLYIDMMVSEALRVFRSPPSKDEIERRDAKNKSFCHSPKERVIGRDESEKETRDIPIRTAPEESESSPAGDSKKDGLKQKEKWNTGTPMQNYSPPVSQSFHTTAKIMSPDVQVMMHPFRQIAPKSVKDDGSIRRRSLTPPKSTSEASLVKHHSLLPAGKESLLTRMATTGELPTAKQQLGQLSKRTDIEDYCNDTCHSAPSFLIPTEDGFRRMQKVDSRIREIYRVTVLRVEGLQTPQGASRHPSRAIYSVYYRDMSFPCVLRSEVPFVPTQLLVQDLFPGMQASRILKAMQRCNILNRYMIRHEQETLQEQLKRRGVSSCKLLPLDEFHDKWTDILSLVHENDQLESQRKLTKTPDEGFEHRAHVTLSQCHKAD